MWPEVITPHLWASVYSYVKWGQQCLPCRVHWVVEDHQAPGTGLGPALLLAALPGGAALVILAPDPVEVSASPSLPPSPQLRALENLPSQV